MQGRYLLDWMTHHYLPLSLFREGDGGPWVVVDNSRHTVIASGGDAGEALTNAYIRLETSPRRCETNIVEAKLGECIACGAANGETCLKP